MIFFLDSVYDIFSENEKWKLHNFFNTLLKKDSVIDFSQSSYTTIGVVMVLLYEPSSDFPSHSMLYAQPFPLQNQKRY